MNIDHLVKYLESHKIKVISVGRDNKTISVLDEHFDDTPSEKPCFETITIRATYKDVRSFLGY